MSEHKLSLQIRNVTGKKLKTLRQAGLIPSVLYGKKPLLTQSSYNETDKVLREVGYHSPISLEIDGKKQLAIVKNIAINPVKRTITNIEFQAVSAREAVVATAPIVVINFETSEASKMKLQLSQAIESIEVKAKPNDLPNELLIDAAQLAAIEDRLTLADLKLPKAVEFADKELDLTQVVVSFHDPATEAAAVEAEEVEESKEAAEAPTEPSTAETNN
mgnify:CR=1 FL=1